VIFPCTEACAVISARRRPFRHGRRFVNDDIVVGNSVWFTDSVNPVLYRLPLGPDGLLPAVSDVQRVPLTGAIVSGPGVNALA
jgi:hypothetical protein